MNPQLRRAARRRPASPRQLLVSESTISWQCRTPRPQLCDSGGRPLLRLATVRNPSCRL